MFTTTSPSLDLARLSDIAQDIGTPRVATVDAERLVYGFREPTPAREPAVRPDVVDATLDAYMIARLIRDYGCSKRDIANTFGVSRLGKCAPIWFDAALVATMRSEWSAL